MELKDLADDIYALTQINWAEHNQDLLNHRFELLSKQIEVEIEKEQDLIKLNYFLELDKGLEMPFELIVDVYKKIITLAPNSKDILEKFAVYLLLHGPDWDDDANEVINLLKVNEIVRASELASRIEIN